MGHSPDRQRPRGAELNWARECLPDPAVLIRADITLQRKTMNQPQPEIEVSDLPLPDTQRELELLLEALNALNDALDHYEAEELIKA